MWRPRLLPTVERASCGLVREAFFAGADVLVVTVHYEKTGDPKLDLSLRNLEIRKT